MTPPGNRLQRGGAVEAGFSHRTLGFGFHSEPVELMLYDKRVNCMIIILLLQYFLLYTFKLVVNVCFPEGCFVRAPECVYQNLIEKQNQQKLKVVPVQLLFGQCLGTKLLGQLQEKRVWFTIDPFEPDVNISCFKKVND